MLLKYLKEFSVKQLLKNSFLKEKKQPNSNKIKTVGLLIDECCFKDKNQLIEQLFFNGFLEKNIEVLLYRSRINKNKVCKYPFFTSNDINWNGAVNNKVVTDFIDKEFDLLISYYDVEKAILLLVTNQSKADFKVGFSSIDKRINNLMINVNAQNYKVFVYELFRYLKILNKI
ncbi:DUF6913 domain-containing protein [Flavobacterium sp.]|uniref:DUF6913 domain-containing protein n=1 Tax=Flavobacterium sp. TaxID=239 RepID=UPI003C32276E